MDRLFAKISAPLFGNPSAPLIKLIGKSGTRYNFFLNDAIAPFNTDAGIYVISQFKNGKIKQIDSHKVLIIGSTDNFSTLFNHQSIQDAIKKYGATHIFTFTVLNKILKEEIEKDLASNYKVLAKF